MTRPGAPDPERWQRVKELLDRALDLGPDERDRFLVEACGDDVELRREVESLLSAYEEDASFLEQPAAEVLLGEGSALRSDEELVGTRIGSYRLVGIVGRGGMGVVYEAVRDDEQFRKRVAVKLMRYGLTSPSVIRRVRQEMRILAQLEHPNIAALLDGGVAADGRPYLVMEYVEGESIHEYCRRHGLNVRERVELFRQLCDAVQFAHRHLVVHRDLKPGNVLVTDDQRVKLLDFGIAKLIPVEESTSPSLTRTTALVLTPDYASPEQIRGERVTTASDVYSLGVILFELLSGRQPFRLGDRSLHELERAISTTDPPKPSAAVDEDTVALGDGEDLRSIRRRISGDLDNIVLKALRKEPERRYDTASQLSDDLGRYLTDQPVEARPDSVLYRVRKFTRRHALLVAAVAAVMLSLAAGVVATATQSERAEVQRRLAERRFQELRTLTNALLFEVHDAVADLPGATRPRDLIVRRGSEYLERLAAESGGDRELQREVAEAYVRLGRVQGQPAGANLGDLEGARRSYTSALALASGLVAADSSDLRARRTLALAHEKLGDVEAWTGDMEAGVREARRALEAFTEIARARPEDAGARLSQAISHVKLGDLLGNPNFPNLEEPAEAEAEYEAARALLDSPPLDTASSWGVRRYRGLVHERRGTIFRVEGRPSRALDAFSRSLAIRRELAEEDPSSVDAARDVAVTRQNLCEVRKDLGRTEAALSDCRAAVEGYRELARTDPENVQARSDLGQGLESLAGLMGRLEHWPEAVEALREATELYRGVYESHPENIPAAREYATALLELGRLRLTHPPDRVPGPPARVEARTCLERSRDVLAGMAAAGAEIGAEERRVRELSGMLGGGG